MFAVDNPLLSAQSLLAFGLPSAIVQAIMPKLLIFTRKYPAIARLLPYLVALLSALGAIVYGIRPLYDTFVNYIWSWLPELELQSDDPLYRYLHKYVNSKAVHTIPNKWMVSTKAKEQDDTCDSDDDENEDEKENETGDQTEKKPNIVYDNPSSRIFYHKGTIFSMDTPDPNTNYGQPISIRAIAPSYKSLNALLSESWATYRTKAVTENTEILEPEYNVWRTRKHKLIRKLTTVDIDEAKKARVVDDVARYLSPATKAWYRKRGIPHRRGYLFHGPPGTGKSSLAAAIAGHFKARLYTLSLTDRNISDSYLLTLMTSVDKGSVILLEDIDSSGIQREDPDTYVSPRSNITLSGLLNALDGAAAPEGHVLIMSTNTPDALDPALVRAGRVDCEIEFKNASRKAAANVFIRMMSDDEDEEKNKDIAEKAQQFTEQIPEEFFSPAEIQGYLLDHARDIEGALRDVKSWVEEVTAKRAHTEEAVEAARKAKDGEMDEKEREVDLLRRRNELEEQALERREAAAAKLEEMENRTKEIQLQAERMRAEADLAKYQTRKGRLSVEQAAPKSPLTPGESDNEQDSFDQESKMDEKDSELIYSTDVDIHDNVEVLQ